MRDNVNLYHGDCLKVMKRLYKEGIQVDGVITDPPYHLQSIVARFGKPGSAPAKSAIGHRISKGFAGKQWDGGDIAFDPKTWAKVLRLMKPGAHLLSFAAGRNYDQMAGAIREAGFEIRRMIIWFYVSGLPKSHDISFNIKKTLGHERHKMAKRYEGYGTDLKPAFEPICLARAPISEKTIAKNVMKHGTGGLNIDATRIKALEAEHEIGKWPSDLIHDGSDEVLKVFRSQNHQSSKIKISTQKSGTGMFFNRPGTNTTKHLSGGHLESFFYCAKADAYEKRFSDHPTIKPVELIRYLVNLIMPPDGGLCLDPFAGSGTLGEAIMREGKSLAIMKRPAHKAILIEQDDQYVKDIEARLASVHETDAPLFGDSLDKEAQ